MKTNPRGDPGTTSEAMQRATLFTLCLCLLLSPAVFAQVESSSDTPAMKRVPVEGGELEYEVRGEGEPVLLIHGAFVAGSFMPLMEEPSLANYRLIRYHRRGFAGSRVPLAPLTSEAEDAVALLRHLGVERAHIVGHSGGGRIALQLALDTPEVVHSLMLLEPAGVGPAPSEFVEEVLEPASARYRAGDPVGAMDIFMRGVAGVGPARRNEIARTVPGGPEQAEQDAATFFEDPTPPEEWVLDEQKAGQISQRIPILYVWGSETLPFLRENRDLFHSWFTQAEDHLVQGVAHLLQMKDPRSVAEGIAAFLRRHPF